MMIFWSDGRPVRFFLDLQPRRIIGLSTGGRYRSGGIASPRELRRAVRRPGVPVPQNCRKLS